MSWARTSCLNRKEASGSSGLVSGCVSLAALRNAVRRLSASSCGRAPSNSYKVVMVVLVLVLATSYPYSRLITLRKSPAAEPPIDDAVRSGKHLGLNMVPVWQNDANRMVG